MSERGRILTGSLFLILMIVFMIAIGITVGECVTKETCKSAQVGLTVVIEIGLVFATGAVGVLLTRSGSDQ